MSQHCLCKHVQASLPESPRWLLLSGAGPEATSAALKRTLGLGGNGPDGQLRVQQQYSAMVDSLVLSDAGEDSYRPLALSDADESGISLAESMVGSVKHVAPSAMELVTAQRFRRPLLIGTSLMLFQQVSQNIMH